MEQTTNAFIHIHLWKLETLLVIYPKKKFNNNNNKLHGLNHESIYIGSIHDARSSSTMQERKTLAMGGLLMQLF